MQASAPSASVGRTFFSDPDGLPRIFTNKEVSSWVRPSAIFNPEQDPEIKVYVVEDKTKGFDLVKENNHLKEE